MKTVFSTSYDVMHLFAQRTQSEGKTQSRNVFFEGDKIYSYGYHYLLGEFINDNTIIINDRGYSVTTSKHISQIRSATSQHKQFYTTRIKFDLVDKEIKYLIKKLAVARKPEIYLSQINSLWASFNEYQDFCRNNNIDTYKINKSKSDFRQLKSLVESALTGQGLNDLIKIEKENRKKELKKKREIAKQRAIEFYNHEINYVHNLQYDLLRISVDGERIETSQGVKVSIESAKLLYSMIKAGRDIKGHRIENYTVISINGTLKIGCHNINMDDVYKVGEQLINK